MNTKNNQRAQATRSVIKAAILRLLEEGESLSTISVAKLCREAEIHRSTFYAHYAFPDDVFQEIEQDVLSQALSFFSGMTPENTIEKVESFLRFVKDNLQVMRLFFVQTRNSTFIEKLSGQVEKDLFRSITGVSTATTQILMPYLIEGSRGMIAAWVENGCLTPEHELAVIINQCNQYAVFGMGKIGQST